MVNKKYWWILIILVAGFWRFWNFENRWILNQDQARDAIIGLYSIRNNVLPEVGPYSSAGPYNFGPLYYWVVIFWEKLIPVVNGPWIGFGIMGVMSVFLYYLIGGWIFGILFALSVAQVAGANDMLNTVAVGFGSAGMWYLTKKFIENEKLKYALGIGLMIGVSINFHFQALGLLAIPLAIIIVNKFSIWKRMWWGFVMGIGTLITFIPLIIFDIKRNGVWIMSVIEYYTVGVNKFYTPIRWLTEIRDFWPQLFGSVTVGINNFGYVWVILGILVISYQLRVTSKIKIDKFWGIVFLTFVIDVFLMRNYKGTRSGEYMIFMHGTIVLICSWITREYYKLNKYIGLLLVAVFVVLASYSNWQKIYKYPSQAKDILEIKSEIDNTVLGNVEIKQFKDSDMVSLPIFYLYYRENRIADGGKIVSICDGNKYQCPQGEIILKNNYRIYFEDKVDWSELSAKNIFERLMINYGIKN